ncbi:MAG: hypothetical protein K0Q86_850 [Arthrobacter koreensis]|jgi:hypothetical protein|nr:hypothetical protein [Arthrobacter koreensis]
MQRGAEAGLLIRWQCGDTRGLPAHRETGTATELGLEERR